MPVFSFLGRVAHGNSAPGGGVFGFLDKQLLPQNKQQTQQPSPINRVAHAVQQIPVVGRADTHILNAARDVGQGTIGAGVPLGVEAYNRVIAPAAGLPQQTIHPQQFGPTGTTLLGEGPVLSPSQTYTESRKTHAAPFSFLLGAAVAAGGVPVGGGSGDLISSLAKASTAEQALKVLTKNGISEDIAKKIAPAIGKKEVTTPEVIQNIIDKAHTPPPSPEQIAASRVAPVGQEIRPAGQGTEAINKHLDTLNNANLSTQGFKDELTKLKQTHEVRNTQELSDKALANVQKDPYGSISQVMGSKNPTDEEVAMGEHIISQAQQAGKNGLAVNVAEHLDNTLREHGRAIQAASLVNRLSPEGRLIYASKRITRAREGSKNAKKEASTVREIQTALDTAGLGDKDIKRVIKEASAAAKEQGVPEQIAKRVASAASPVEKQQVDQLVNEIVKKVKQEHLEPKPGAKKAPLDVIKEVMQRNPEAQAAYPEAQSILKEKYANNEVMSEALDKFFGSDLGNPVAGTTFERAISDELKASKTSVPDIIKQSIKNQQTSAEDISGNLIKEGFDEQSAKVIGREVSDRLATRIREAKISTLENLSKKAKDYNKTTFIESVNKLSNLGALEGSDYINLARAKLNLPHLNETSAAKIHQLSQKIQDLSPGEEQYKLIRELHDTVNAGIPNSKGEIFRQVFAAPRSVKASFDVSGLGRQGAVLGTRFPSEWKDAWEDSVKSFGSQKYYDKAVAELQTGSRIPEHLREEYLAAREKAEVALVGGPDALHEEAFASQLPEKVYGAGKVIEGSDRAYTLGLSSLRDRTFENIFMNYQHIKPMSEWSDKHIKSIGRFINTASGRGDLGKYLETHGKTLQEALFSPKLWKSRLDLINPYYYWKLKGPARKYAAQSGATFTGTTASIMALAVAAGAKVETDPRSSDFLKIRVGDTRFDIMGGLQQNLVFLWREISGQKKSSQTGKVTDLGSGDYGAPTRLSILSDLFQSKENPSVAEISKQIKGQDQSGNVLTPGARLKSLAGLGVPLSIGDTYNNVTHSENLGAGIAKSIPGVLGVGVNSYGVQDINVTGKEKDYLDKLKEQGVDSSTINANKQFFQILKSAPSKQTALDNAHKALDAGDYQKAARISIEYNAALDQYIASTGWVDKNSQYISPILEKQYESARFNLNAGSIKSYLKSKQGL